MSISVIGIPTAEMLKRKATDLYDPAYRRALSDELSAKGHVGNHEVRGKKADGTPFWLALFIRPLKFSGKSCLLSAWHDISQRKLAEEEICKLREQLDREIRRREGKYLFFKLAGEVYGISILNVREILGLPPVTPVPGTPDFIRGVVNLRGKVIPVTDIRIRFGLEVSADTDRTCIIIVDIDKGSECARMGILADSVSEVLHVRGKGIEDTPAFGTNLNTDYILGMLMKDGEIRVLLDIDQVFGANDLAMIRQ